MMLRRLTLISTLLLAVTTFAGKAEAQSVDVEFEGSISNACTITTDNTGNNAVALTLIDAQTLGTQDTGGTVTVTCATTGQLTVAEPTATSPDAQALANTTLTSALYSDAGLSTQVTTNDGAPYDATINNTATDFYVGMNVANDAPIPPGDYGYTVSVTVTAQ